jgi:hypothetical protein
MLARHRRLVVLAAVAGVTASASLGAAGARPNAAKQPLADALKRGYTAAAARPRAEVPEDRYALAGGCYVA